MVSTRKKRQSYRRLLGQLDDFDPDIIIGNIVSDRQENAEVNKGTGDHEFTVDNSGSNSAANKILVNMRTLERCFIEKFDKEMGDMVDTVGDKIQNAIFTAIDSIITPRIELAIRSINASSGRDATSVTTSSVCGEHIGISAPFETYPRRTIHYMCLIRMMRLEIIFQTR